MVVNDTMIELIDELDHKRVPIPDCCVPSRARDLSRSRYTQIGVRYVLPPGPIHRHRSPDLIESVPGHPPAVALFATQARYKREAFRGSEFAPRILADNGLHVVMKVSCYMKSPDVLSLKPGFLA